jgi:transaldolase
MNARLQALSQAGVSIWLDDLSRARLTSGNLAGLIRDSSVVGVTTNPSIFAEAISHGEVYGDLLSALKTEGVSVAEAITRLTTSDVRDACDVFEDTYAASKGENGRVSIEVEPGLALQTDATINQARELHDLVGRENVLIKIPATRQGLPAISATIAAGISVNVTLIFSTERYLEVIDAYLYGLEQAAASGFDLSRIHSVASVFVSRIDTEVDKRLDAIGGDAVALKGKAAIANAQLAYAAYQTAFTSERFAKLEAKGAHAQRALWASTGVKNPDYPDTLYVGNLVAPNVVNTMPEKTLMAYADHGEIGDPVVDTGLVAAETMRALEAVGIDLADVFKTLEDEGVEKFQKSWGDLTATVEKSIA